MALNTATSVVDYLKSQGKPSDFTYRSGLATQYGIQNYTGTAEQNTQLLGYLNKPTYGPVQPPTVTGGTPPVYGPVQPPSLNTVQTTGQSTLNNILSAGSPVNNPSIVDYLNSQGKPSDYQTRSQMAAQYGIQGYTGTADQNTQLLNYLRSGQQPQQSGQPPVPAPVPPPAPAKPPTPQGDYGASNVMDFLGVDEFPSESELIKDVLNSSEFKMFSDRLSLRNMTDTAKAQEIKDALEVRFAQDKTDLETRLGAAGLGMSGIRATQVKALVDSLAASKLSVDRDLASKLMESDLDLREQVMDSVANMLQEAKKANKERRSEILGILEDQGLTIDLATGNLVPTLAAMREERVAEQQRIANEMSEARYALSEARFEYQMAKDDISQAQAEARLALAEKNYQLSEARFNASQSDSSGTEKERMVSAVRGYSEKLLSPGAQWYGITIIGDDGYMDPRVWKAAINDVSMYGMTRKDFIESFGHLINPGKKPIKEYGLTDKELQLLGIG